MPTKKTKRKNYKKKSGAKKQPKASYASGYKKR